MTTKWPDVSEWQGVIDWKTLGAAYPLVCTRLLYGATYRDKFMANNRAQARSYVTFPGWYQYLRADQDPVVQAEAFATAIGTLGPREWGMLDIEEGSGDQTSRALAWRKRFDAHYGPGRSCVYSYSSFFASQLRLLPLDWPRIVASYGSGAPAFQGPVVGWQYSSNVTFPGITGGCDANVSPYPLDQLLPLLGAEMGDDLNAQEHQTLMDNNAMLKRLIASNTRIEAALYNDGDTSITHKLDDVHDYAHRTEPTINSIASKVGV